MNSDSQYEERRIDYPFPEEGCDSMLVRGSPSGRILDRIGINLGRPLRGTADISRVVNNISVISYRSGQRLRGV